MACSVHLWLGTLFIGLAAGLRLEPAIEHILITTGGLFNIECSHDTSVKWKYPKYDRIPGQSSEIQISEKNSNGIYNSTLTIVNASYMDTGFYICIPENDTDKTEEVKIYVYVRSIDNLLALNETFSVLTPHQYDDLLIPCRPTSPDIDIILYKDGEVVNAKFNPFTGFKLTNLQIMDSGTFTCLAKRGSMEDQSYNFHIMVRTKTRGISKPKIELLNQAYVIRGQSPRLSCSVSVSVGVSVDLCWEIPPTVLNESRFDQGMLLHGTSNNVIRTMTIHNVSETDQGIYTCKVRDHSNNSNEANYELKVITPGMKYLNISIEGGNEIQARVSQKNAQWTVYIDSYPTAEVKWFDPNGTQLPSESNKFSVSTDENRNKVIVKDVDILDSGIYKVKADNGEFQKTLNITLLVEDRPTAKMTPQPYYFLNKKHDLKCSVIAYPVPRVTWYFRGCSRYPQCDSTISEIPSSIFLELPNGVNIEYVSYIVANQTGEVTCRACNYIGCHNETIPFFVTDINEGFDLWGPSSYVVASDNVTLGCGASVYNYTSQIEWFIEQNNTYEPIYNSSEIGIMFKQTSYSFQSVLIINDIQPYNSGNYLCRVKSNLNYSSINEKKINIVVKDLHPPIILSINSTAQSGHTYKAGDAFTAYCNVTGIPHPVINWYKDGHLLKVSEDKTRVSLLEKNTILNIPFIMAEDDGLYECKANNRAGSDSMEFQLHVRHTQKWELILGLFCFMLLIFIMPLVYLTVKREKKLRKGQKDAIINNFATGQIDSLNPEINIHDQADLLPYDKKWEFPRDKLKLGKQLGSGAFGVVLKAEAFGMHGSDEPVIVAVKMVKKNSNFDLIKALALELKLMANLGQHLNVVNLIGACTENINNGELLVLVEYCRYGSLHGYLLRHRDAFINQINPESGIIEATTSNKAFELPYIPDASVGLRSNNTQVSEYSNLQTGNTEMTSLSTPVGDDGYLVSKEPDWRSSYQGDHGAKNDRPICSQDLLCWSYQIARGMEYLASRKVLHGDLAARNILLAEENVVKICDFGFARHMNSGNYCKKGNDPLPVKWMSIEALRDSIFSTQSDIWAFGIVLWEIFALAKTPYPGIQFGQKLFNKLLEGYRMEKPEFATKDMYNLMKDCWQEEPMSRPSFTECAERIGSMLEESVKQHYLDLNDPYMQFNSQLPSQSDYLSMLNAPTFANFCSATSDQSPSEGYINMHRGQTEAGDDLEMKPMLRPDIKSFLNPGYEGLNRIKENTYANVSQQPAIEV